jgi:short-subunit dehydrogenase
LPEDVAGLDDVGGRSRRHPGDRRARPPRSEALGGIDVLIHNAAIPKRRAVTALDPFDAEAVMRVNFTPTHLTLTVLPLMLRRRGGRIVNVSSIGGRLGIIHEHSDRACKFALCGWSEALAVDVHSTGVSVKLFEPGPVATEICGRCTV